MIGKTLIILLNFLYINYSGAEVVFELSKSVYERVPFSTLYSDNGALIRNINYFPIKQLKLVVEKQFKVRLKDRGEAHITVITPPEGSAFSHILSNKDVLSIYQQNMQETSFEIKCLGHLKNNEKQVYYLVVESTDLFHIREEIENILKGTINGPIPFKSRNYYPHITVGFIGNDIHDQKKDLSTCIGDILFSK